MGRAANVNNLFITLIRTHHITSRKKLQRVKKAAEQCEIPFVLVRSGGAPGIMYAEGPDEGDIANWVGAVKSFQYKDFQWAQKTSHAPVRMDDDERAKHVAAGFNEVATVAEFGEVMSRKGLSQWWKVGMGYEAGDR